MKTRDLLFPFIFIPVGLAFVTVCILLYFNSDSKKLIAAKIRMGALLLGFSTFVGCGTPQPTCYDVAAPQNSSVFELGNSKKAGDTINAHVYSPTYPHFAIEILSSDGKTVQQSLLVTPLSDSITAMDNNFYFVLDSGMPAGLHKLRFYGEQSPSLTRQNLLDEFDLLTQ